MSSTKLGKKVLSITLATSTTLWLSGLSLIAPIASAAAPGNLMDGDTFRVGTDAKVYIAKMVGGKYFKRWVMTPDIFNVYGHLSWSKIKSVAQADADMYVESKLVRVETDAKVWYLDGMTRRHVATPEAFAANGWDWQAVYQINAKEAAFYPEGAQVTGVLGSPSPSVTGTMLRVDMPTMQIAATTMVSGSTAAMGAESLRSVMKIKFTAGDGDVKVKKVVLTRGGISADSDINDMYLYDGATRVAETPAISSSRITFSNSSGIFVVNRGASKEITVKIDLTSNTAGGKTINFSVAAATDVETDGATVSGTFPVASNTHSTANVTDLGRMLFQNSYPSAATTVDPQIDLDAWRFTAAASNQDVEVRRMRITFVGTIVSTDLVNIKLLDGGVQVGSTIANLDSNKVADFDLSAKPIAVKSGQTRTLTVRVDVVGGTNRTFRASVQKRADVEVYDTGYKVWIRPMTSSTADSFSIMQPNSSADFSGTNRDFTINVGTLTVTVSTDSPTGNVANGATNVPLARYDFKAAGEGIKVTDLAVCLDFNNLTGANDGLANGKVFVNNGSGTEYVQVGTTDSNLNVDDDAAADCDDAQDFNAFALGSQFIVDAGKTRQVEIRADITRGSSSGTATASGDTYVISLNNGNSSTAANAQGLVSLTSITAPSADLAARTVTNSAAALSVAKNEGLGDYTTANPLVVGQSKVKVASIAITAGSGEGIDLNSIILQANGTDGREWGRNLTNLMLCKSGTACSTGNQIGSTATSLSTTDEAETKTFTVSPPITITAGTQYLIDVHADVLSSASDTGISMVGVRVAATGVTGTGKQTGTSVSAPTAVTNMQNIYIAGGGTMSVTAAPSSDLPVTQIYTMTPTSASAPNEVVVGKFRLNPQFEDFNVTRIILNDTFTVGMGSTTASSTLRNVRVYSGSVSSANLIAGPVNPVSTITPVVGSYVDFNGGFKTGGGLTASADATQILVPKDVIKTLVVTAETNTYLNSSSGQTHLFSLQASPQLTTRAITARGAVTSTSGNGPTANTNISNTYEIRRNYPIVAPCTSSCSGYSDLATKLSNGSGQTIYRYKVTAPSTGDEVRVKKMTFQVVMTDTTTTSGVLAVSSWQLKRNGSLVTASDYRFFNGAVATTSVVSSLGGTGTIAGCAATAACDDNEADGLRAYNAGVTGTYTQTSTTTTAVLVFATEEAITAGSSNTYEIIATIANVSTASGDSDAIALSMLGDAAVLGGQRTGDVAVTQLAPAGGFGVSIGGAAATSANFVWADLWQGVTAHGTPTAETGTVTVGTDWTNAFLVPEILTAGVATDFLPTSQFLMSK